MFSFFKKKNEPTVCNHKWKDFPWYIARRCNYDYGEDAYYQYKVIEPYICIKCKERRDEILEHAGFSTRALREKEIERLLAAFPDRIREQIEVEDMVKDEQLVDREYLKLLEQFENPTDRFAGLDLFSEIQKAKKEMAAIGVVAKIGES